jgi:hypothetical protein
MAFLSAMCRQPGGAQEGESIAARVGACWYGVHFGKESEGVGSPAALFIFRIVPNMVVTHRFLTYFKGKAVQGQNGIS